MHTGIETLCRLQFSLGSWKTRPQKEWEFWHPALGYHHKEGQNVIPVRSRFG